jgi:hypothetical protein
MTSFRNKEKKKDTLETGIFNLSGHKLTQRGVSSSSSQRTGTRAALTTARQTRKR